MNHDFELDTTKPLATGVSLASGSESFSARPARLGITDTL